MARERIVVGIDVGTHYVYTVVGVANPDTPLPQIIGMGRSRAYGIRRGMIIDMDDATSAIRKSVKEAEQASGVSISSAFVSIGGNHIISMPSRGVVAVSRADQQISEDDVVRVITAAKTVALPPNREILHAIPMDYIIDGESGHRDVVGMSGLRLEANALIVGGSSGHLRNLTRAIADAGVTAEGFVLSALAASHAVLSKRQKELGVLCLDIGGGTTDMAVFEEGNLVYTNVIPLGGDSITSDLAIGLRTTIETAERVKREYGMALAAEAQKRDVIELAKFDPKERDSVMRRDVADIMEARLNEILELVNKDLRRIGKEALLPGGVVLVGGTAKVPHLVELTKSKLRLPAQVGFPRDVEGIVGSVDDPSFAAALGLVFWGLEQQGGGSFGARVTMPRMGDFSGSVSKMQKWARAFLP
jgi:cell division protein FtsA